ncbi:MAG: hypothetical protein WCE94_14645 [Candidatus Methanoperedens sp.]
MLKSCNTCANGLIEIEGANRQCSDLTRVLERRLSGMPTDKAGNYLLFHIWLLLKEVGEQCVCWKEK